MSYVLKPHEEVWYGQQKRATFSTRRQCDRILKPIRNGGAMPWASSSPQMAWRVPLPEMWSQSMLFHGIAVLGSVRSLSSPYISAWCTIFSSTKMPLTTWFFAIYLITQSQEGCVALKLLRFLGISQTAAMSIKHKLQMVMKTGDGRRPLRDFVQIDDVYWGGRRPGGKRGRGSEGKTSFVAALQRNYKRHPVFIRFSSVGSFNGSEKMRWG